MGLPDEARGKMAFQGWLRWRIYHWGSMSSGKFLEWMKGHDGRDEKDVEPYEHS